MTLDPKSWGPSFWSMMHWTAAGFSQCPTEDEKQNFKLFFEHLQNILPCTECRQHFTSLLKQMPIDAHLETSTKLRQWVTDVHNAVNEQMNSNVRYTLEQTDKTYPTDDDDEEPPPEMPKTKTMQVTPIPINTPQPPLQQHKQQQQQRHLLKPISRQHQMQMIANNNARIMGRIGSRLIIHPSTVRTISVPKSLSSQQPQIQIHSKRKKGCNCKK